MMVVMINTQFDTIQMDRRLHQSVMFNILLIKKEIPRPVCLMQIKFELRCFQCLQPCQHRQRRLKVRIGNIHQTI